MEETEKEELANIIKKNLIQEFETIHFSGNLMNTIKVYQNENGNWCVEIPAMLYNLKQFKARGVIIPYYKGSYAERINQTGGFSGKHKNYVENIIKQSIQEWLGSIQKKGTVRSK